jgi:hypothetical protein
VSDSSEQVDSDDNQAGRKEETTISAERKSIFEKWQDKFKEFLDKA